MSKKNNVANDEAAGKTHALFDDGISRISDSSERNDQNLLGNVPKQIS